MNVQIRKGFTSRLFGTTGYLLLLTFLTACNSGQERNTTPKAAEDRVLKRSNELYCLYVTGNENECRNALQQCVRLFEDSELAPRGRANGLYLTYCRLYTLEKRMGNQDAADEAFLKARYWNLQQVELSGHAAEEAIATDKSFTPDWCFAFVDKWDKNHTGGNGPKYAEEIRKNSAK